MEGQSEARGVVSAEYVPGREVLLLVQPNVVAAAFGGLHSAKVVDPSPTADGRHMSYLVEDDRTDGIH